MGRWREVTQCQVCKRLYQKPVPDICYKCGIRLREPVGLLTVDAVNVVARRKWFRWEIKND